LRINGNPIGKKFVASAGVDPGFFLEGGPTLRNDVTDW